MAKVLVVDDDAANRELIVTLLRYAGHEFREASDGIEGIAQIRAWQPHLVVCDILMPRMDGYELVRQLRADPATAATPVIFSSATFLESEARVLAAACGVRRVLTKPCEPEVILEAITQALNQTRHGSVAEPAEAFDRNHLRLLTDKLVEKVAALEHAYRQLAAIGELNLQLASERDPHVLIDHFCRGACALFEVHGVVAMVGGLPDGAVPYLAAFGANVHPSRAPDNYQHIPLPTGTREPYARLTGAEVDAVLAAVAVVAPAGYPGLVAPITSLHRSYGWILLLGPAARPEFNDGDGPALSTQAAQVGRVYENGILYARVQQQLVQLQEHANQRDREQRLLRLEHAVARALASATSPSVGVKATIQTICEAKNWEFGRFWRVEPHAGILYVADYWHGSNDLSLEPILASGMPLRRGEGLAGQVWLTELELWVPDLSTEETVVDRGLVQQLGIASCCVFPVFSEKGMIGVVSFSSRQTRAPDERLRTAIRMACSQLGQFLSRKDAEAALLASEQFTQRTLDSLTEHICVLDAQGTILSVNHTWREFTLGQGAPMLRALPGENYLQACEATGGTAAAEALTFSAGIKQVLDGQQASFSMEYPSQAGESMRWFLARVNRFAQSAPMRVVVSHEDITERRSAEERGNRLHRVAAVLGAINALIVRVGSRDELFRDACRIAIDTGKFAKAWVALLAPGGQRAVIGAAADVSGDMAYFEKIEGLLATKLAAGNPAFEQIVRGQRPFIVNDIAHSPLMGLPELAVAGGARAMVGLPLRSGGQTVGSLMLYAPEADFFDDEEMKLLNELAGDMSFALEHIAQSERVNYLAYYDSLTGCASSALFSERLAQFLTAARQAQQETALAIVNLERFRTVNDTLGRHAGDILLKEVARRLLAFANDPARVARVGADHFAVVFPNTKASRIDADVVRGFTELEHACFGPPFMVTGTELRISARIGIAFFPGDGDDAETLYRNAEAAMRKARKAAENVLFYNPRMNASVAERLALENELGAALRNDEFVLHYQPKVNVDTLRMEGMEALIRWQHPVRGLVSPGTFVPLLEDTGLIIAAGAWALRRAALDYQAWSALGLQPPRIAVNVSAIQLRRQDFVTTVEAALTLDKAPLGIDVEITESVVMEDIDETVRKLHALRRLGIEVAIDDFGTGYSSLAYLAKLPAQVLKIDRAFVIPLSTDPANVALVSTMISLAHALRMKVVAEGVETQDQANMLRLLRCDQMQGFLISRPKAFDAISEDLRARMQE